MYTPSPRVDDAENALGPRLLRLLETKKTAQVDVPPEVVDQAARFAVRLARETTKASWVDYVIDLYTAEGRPIPAPLIDELDGALRKVYGLINLGALHAYVEGLRASSASFDPAGRELLQRLEDFERRAKRK